MKSLVVYKTKYGSTKQYAEWISKELGADIAPADEKIKFNLADYDVLVFGGYFRMGQIAIAPFIIENWGKIKNKKVVLFSTSGAYLDQNHIKATYESCLPEYIRKSIAYFPLTGRIDSSKFTFFDSVLMFVATRLPSGPESKKNKSIDFDGVKKENIKPIIAFIKKQGKRQ